MNLVAVVLVQLSEYEGRKVGVLERAGQDGLCKLVHVLDEEAGAVGTTSWKEVSLSILG